MMHSLLSLVLLGASFMRVEVAAFDMAKYQPAHNVDTGFKSFLQDLYSAAEDAKATTKFTDFFPPQGILIVVNTKAVGAKEIIKLKQSLLPTDGSKRWNHKPNVTTVFQDTPTTRTYDVEGVIQSIFTPGNCSQAYFSTRFTVAKTAGGVPRLTPHSGSLIEYNDLVLVPTRSPTDIPCS